MKPTCPHKRAEEEETADFLQMHQSDDFSPFPSCTTQAPSTSVNKVLQKTHSQLMAFMLQKLRAEKPGGS